MTRYYIHSGEGETGHWERFEGDRQQLEERLADERSGGDRWAHAYQDAYELAEGGYAAMPVDGGEPRQVPSNIVLGAEA